MNPLRTVLFALTLAACGVAQVAFPAGNTLVREVFPEITAAGNGWSGATTPTGSGPVAIARWNQPEWLNIADRYMTFGVVAFHKSGIREVLFSLNGGPWVASTKMLHNSDTWTTEYGVTLDGTALVDGTYELRAIARPVAGRDRVLTTPVVVDRTPWVVAYVSPSGVDTPGNGTVSAPYRTPGYAITRGATLVYLTAGMHYWHGGQDTVQARSYVHVTAAPGLGVHDVVISSTNSGGVRATKVHLSNVTVTTVLVAGSNTPRWIWAERVMFVGDGVSCSPSDPHFIITTMWTHRYMTECYVGFNAQGARDLTLARNCIVERCADAFTGTLMVTNGLALGLEGVEFGCHSDLYQITAASTATVENRIVYGMRGYDIRGQCLFTNDAAAVHNIAYVNYFADFTASFFNASQWSVPSSDHILLWGVTLVDQEFWWRTGTYTNVSVVGCVFDGGMKYLGGVLVNPEFRSNHYTVTGTHFVTPGTDVTTGTPGFRNPGSWDYAPGPGSVLLDRVAPVGMNIDANRSFRTSPADVGAFEIH